MKSRTTLFLSSKQRLHKSQFLQKLSCQKHYWDQARLSSLVRGPKSAHIRLYRSTEDLCPPVKAYVRLSHGHTPLLHPRETLVEGEAGDLIPSLPFAEVGFGEEDARGTCIVLP